MIIKEFGLRNFQSFGNAKQSIKLSTRGELILLVGRSGNGKSALMGSLDFALFKKVKSKTKKTMTLTNLPNRINKELVSDVLFNLDGNEYYVERGINPNYVKLSENGVFDEKAGANFIDAKIVNLVGMEFESFKSFISTSINDFKNFIYLSNEEKKMLLDKLFNLEYINQLNGILKTIVSDNKKELDILDNEINTISDSVYSIQQSIEKSKEKNLENIDKELIGLETIFREKHEIFKNVKQKSEEVKEKQTEVKKKIENEKVIFIGLNNEIKNIENKIALYNQGKCPECESNLKDQLHKELLQGFIDKKDKLFETKAEITEKVKKFKEAEQKLDIMFNELNGSFYNLKNELTSMQSNKKLLESKKNSKDESLNEFLLTLKNLEDKREVVKNKKSESDDKIMYHKILSEIFGENGIKNIIIKNIIVPINNFIQKNVNYLGLPFEVEITENFDAVIRNLGDEIDPETLSTGEMRKVNICIMTSYLALIRTKININLLFLDEVFSSIDVESIKDVIWLLRNFANEYNINIFLIHHSILDNDDFDRVIQVNKDIFSTIQEIKN